MSGFMDYLKGRLGPTDRDKLMNGPTAPLPVGPKPFPQQMPTMTPFGPAPELGVPPPALPGALGGFMAARPPVPAPTPVSPPMPAQPAPMASDPGPASMTTPGPSGPFVPKLGTTYTQGEVDGPSSGAPAPAEMSPPAGGFMAKPPVSANPPSMTPLPESKNDALPSQKYAGGILGMLGIGNQSAPGMDKPITEMAGDFIGGSQFAAASKGLGFLAQTMQPAKQTPVQIPQLQAADAHVPDMSMMDLLRRKRNS